MSEAILKRRPWLATVLSLTAALSGCGGGGGGSSPTVATTATTATATPTTATAATCSLASRESWALAQFREWYLFPETLPSNLDPTRYTTLDDYVDALTATARAQGRDRYFTYVTSIASEDSYYSSGSSVGFGVRLSYDTTGRRLFVSEAFENTSALAAGIDRGTEILAIGDTSASLRNVSDIIAAGGTAAVNTALGASTAGLSRALRVTDSAGTRVVTVAKADYDLAAVSSRYGARTIQDNGRQIGYINLRTFITPADPALRQAFAAFRAAGITDYVIDLRYNGGGLVSIASLMGNLLGGNRASSDVFAYLTYRPEKTSNNQTYNFAVQPQSVSPAHIAFIGTGGTASASELVINAFVPYLHAQVALIGTNTYGKPVGQIALDNTACDDRLRLIAFATENSVHNGQYFTGLAGSVEASCSAADDLSHPFGDPQESSTRQALDFVEGRSCSRISADGITTQSLVGKQLLLTPDHPAGTIQREVPGAF